MVNEVQNILKRGRLEQGLESDMNMNTMIAVWRAQKRHEEDALHNIVLAMRRAHRIRFGVLLPVVILNMFVSTYIRIRGAEKRIVLGRR